MTHRDKLDFYAVVWAFFALIYLMFLSSAVGEQMEDVIYLKNGSVIRGIIVEQYPDKHIKIQTREGNLFVYETHQIDRIMKEPRSVRIGGRSRKSPGVALALSLGGGLIVDGVGQFYNGDLGKGFSYVAWSLISQALIVAGTEDNQSYGYDRDDDDFLTTVGAVSRIGCYISAAIDAYKSAMRKNIEVDHGIGIPSYPRFNLGVGSRGSIFVVYRQMF